MKKLLNPKVLLFISLLPLIVLMSLFYAQYSIIKSLLNSESFQIWKSFGYLTMSILIVHSITLVYFLKNKKTLHKLYAIITLFIYIGLAYWYSYHTDDFIPFNIPRWMISTELIIYVGSFLMPTIIHSIIVVMLDLTKKIETQNSVLNFGLAFTVPFLWYMTSQIALPLYKIVDSQFGEHLIFICIIASIISFLFFLFRGIYILVQNKSEKWKKYDLIWKIPIALVFPILGLLLNNGIIAEIISARGDGVFGNFNNPWFYIIAVCNGILLCLPQFSNPKTRLVLFALKAITYCYTVYFFLIFIPFLPFSVVAVIALGLGFLMLAPLLLFVFQTTQMQTDFQFLKAFYSKTKLISIQLIGFCILPLSIIGTFIHDKMILNETLEYVYAPNLNKTYTIDKKSLENTLQKISIQKNSKNNILFGSQTPYISMLFNWIVLDNLTLSDEKINTIEAIFTGTQHSSYTLPKNENSNVKFNTYTISTKYDHKNHCYKSWVNLNLKNNSNSDFQGYTTQFTLPENCFISDYYLYVGKHKKKGLLTEKKSALWVFNQIQNENKDPGILYYQNDTTLGFKVFPFTAQEERKTGFEIIHKEDVSLVLDGKTIFIPVNPSNDDAKIIETQNAIYIPISKKNQLEQIVRKPIYNFIIDVSSLAKKDQNHQIETIEQYIAREKINKDAILFTVCNSTINTISSLEELKNYKYEGGFYLERALQKNLIQNYKSKNPKQLIPIVVTENIQQAIMSYDFNNLSFTFPEHRYFYNLQTNGQLNSHDLTFQPKEVVAINQKVDTKIPVYRYPLKNSYTYFPLNATATVLLKNKETYKVHNLETLDLFTQGIETKAMMQLMLLNPEQKESHWFNLLKLSFTSKILNPITAFIVVENEAQEKMLLKKQQEVINGNKNLDLEESEIQRMSEPEVWIILLLILAYIFFKHKSKLKTT